MLVRRRRQVTTPVASVAVFECNCALVMHSRPSLTREEVYVTQRAQINSQYKLLRRNSNVFYNPDR